MGTTKFYLVPSYDFENMFGKKKLAFDDINLQQSKSILDNKKISMTDALTIFDRDNKLNVNMEKTNAAVKPEIKHAETQTVDTSENALRSREFEQKLKDELAGENPADSSEIWHDSSQFVQNSPDVKRSINTDKTNNVDGMVEYALNKTNEVVADVPKGFENNAKIVYQMLVKKKLWRLDKNLNIYYKNSTIPMSKLMRAIFFAGANVSAYQKFFEMVAPHVPAEYVRNYKFEMLRDRAIEDGEKNTNFQRGGGGGKYTFRKKLKWLVY